MSGDTLGREAEAAKSDLENYTKDVDRRLSEREREIAALAESQRRLEECAEKLLAELSDVQIQAVREGAGNTNAAVLRLRRDELRALLTPPPPAKETQ